MEIHPIAYIHSDFRTKFGIPRQSGITGTRAEIIFEPEYGMPDTVRGLEQFSHIWLIWGFSGNAGRGWHATVRPPRLGGNTRVGVYATRSPFRPNSLGLSSVRLESIEFRSVPVNTQQAPDQNPASRMTVPILHVLGADLMDGTPIYDIKPYIPYADCHTDAAGGFTAEKSWHELRVTYNAHSGAEKLPQDKLAELTEVLRQDPRPSYQHDPERIYGMDFALWNVRFKVNGDELLVIDIQSLDSSQHS